jgi:hypothetical protein
LHVVTQDVRREEPSEGDVWWSELVGLAAGGGVMLGGFLAFSLASWVVPQMRGLWTILTVLASSWLARRAYASAKGKHGFASEGVGHQL